MPAMSLDAQDLLRCQAVKAVLEQRMNQQEAAYFFDVSRYSISKWLKVYKFEDAGGLGGEAGGASKEGREPKKSKTSSKNPPSITPPNDIYLTDGVIVLNDQGEIMSFTITPGNTDDGVVVEKLTQHLTGLLFGDRGYITKN